jgi:predicted DNA-binding transcriptional regulator
MRMKICLTVFLFAMLLGPFQTAFAQLKPNLAGLNTNERRVIEYLLDDWRQDYSLTAVDIAMEALGLPPSDAMRFRIGSHIKKHPELHEVVRQWGWQTLSLTPNEKLAARAIVNAERDKQRPPSIADLAKLVGISEKDAVRAVEMLARFGILKRDRSVGGIGYVAAAPRYVNWTPWLDFQFHRLTLSSGRIFCTN